MNYAPLLTIYYEPLLAMIPIPTPWKNGTALASPGLTALPGCGSDLPKGQESTCSATVAVGDPGMVDVNGCGGSTREYSGYDRVNYITLIGLYGHDGYNRL